jgi:hypothetical protein
MTPPARDALRRITAALRKAAGVPDAPASPEAPPATTPPGNRADAAGSGATLASEARGRVSATPGLP